MKKRFKLFCLLLAGIMIFALLVSVGTIKLPEINSDDDTGDNTGVMEPAETYYPIMTNLEHVKLVSYTSLKVSASSDTVCLTFAADEGYILPEEVEVLGCEYMWNESEGWLFLANATGNVAVSVAGIEGEAPEEPDDPSEATYYDIVVNTTKTNSVAGNATQMSDQDGYVVLKFSAYNGYTLPSAVTVSGCSYIWNRANGTLTLSKPVGKITITITSTERIYRINTSLDGVEAAAGNSDSVPGSLIGSNIVFYYSAKPGYNLPEKITVSGASYSWSSKTGNLILSNITGNVYITITGVPIVYYLNGTYHLKDDLDVVALANYWKGVSEDKLSVNFTTGCDDEYSGFSVYEDILDDGEGIYLTFGYRFPGTNEYMDAYIGDYWDDETSQVLTFDNVRVSYELYNGFMTYLVE